MLYPLLKLLQKKMFYCWNKDACVGFIWQDFGNAEGVAAVPSLRRHRKLSPCQAETVPGGSWMDLLLAKPQPGSDARDSSAVAYLTKG